MTHSTPSQAGLRDLVIRTILRVYGFADAKIDAGLVGSHAHSIASQSADALIVAALTAPDTAVAALWCFDMDAAPKDHNILVVDEGVVSEAYYEGESDSWWLANTAGHGCATTWPTPRNGTQRSWAWKPAPSTATGGGRMFDWLGYQLLMRGPWWITCNANTRIGRWCLRHAGSYAYPTSTAEESAGE